MWATVRRQKLECAQSGTDLEHKSDLTAGTDNVVALYVTTTKRVKDLIVLGTFALTLRWFFELPTEDGDRAAIKRIIDRMRDNAFRFKHPTQRVQ